MQPCSYQRVRRASWAATAGARRRRRRRGGFSLVELLVVVGILVILVSIFVPYVAKMREAGRRAGCANNLRAVHAAMSRYAEANRREFPRAAADPARPGGYAGFTGADFDGPPASGPAATSATSTTAAAGDTQPATEPAIPRVGPEPAPATASAPATQPRTNPADPPARSGLAAAARPAPGGVQFNDVTASLWLLVRGGYADAQHFVCPSGDETTDPMLSGGKRVPTGRRSNFTSARHLSYSYCSPFSGNPRFRLNTDVLPADFAILADKNPGARPTGGDVTGPAYTAPREQFAAANSRNHGRAGQNVLYPTGVVEFQGTPYCGYGPPKDQGGIYRDNVYTAYAASPLDGDTVPTDLAVNGVCTPAAGPAWVYDSYLVPTDDE